VFELSLGNFLNSHDLQFGFKKDIGCANAVYVVQQVVKHFTSRSSAVCISSLDASKAFDRVNLSWHILFEKLIGHNFPFCLIKVLVNWYSKLTAVVRWNCIFSVQSL